MCNEHEKNKKTIKEIEEKAKELEKNTKEKIENMEQDIKKTLEESDRERAEIVEELMTPLKEDIEDNTKDKNIDEDFNKEKTIKDDEINQNENTEDEEEKFKYKPLKLVKRLDIVAKIILTLAIISAVILAMQKQPIMTPFGGYAGYEWAPISLVNGALSAFSGYVAYELINALTSIVENIDKNRQLKELELKTTNTKN